MAAKPSGMGSKRLRKLSRDNRGASIVEYALLLFLVMVTAATVYNALGRNVRKAGDLTVLQFSG